MQCQSCFSLCKSCFFENILLQYFYPDTFPEEPDMSSVILSASYAHRRSHKTSHYHDCHQIIYITAGTASIRVGNTDYTARAGDLVIFSRFEQHAVTSRSEDYRRYVLHIAPQLPAGSDISERLFTILSNRPAGFTNILDVRSDAEQIEEIIRRITLEQEQQNLLSEAMENLLMEALLICIHRRFPNYLDAISEDCMKIIWQLQNRFETNYRQNYVLGDVAEEYGFSVSYLSHMFKKVTGNSIMGYLLSCRIAAAKKYLAETTMSIGQIVELCGFSDGSNFSRSFRQLTGLTPSQFRQSYQ